MLIKNQINIKNNPNFLRWFSRFSPEYKQICLVMWIITGDEFYVDEGHCIASDYLTYHNQRSKK